MTRPTPNEDSKSPGLAPEVLEESQGEDRIEQRIRVPNELACWPGHFPEHPVVPGVLQVHWAMELAARWRGATPAVRRIEVLQFKHTHYDVEVWPGFYGIYGLVGCTLLVLAAKVLRKGVMRDEDYYDR
jgi:hypothetical protein